VEVGEQAARLRLLVPFFFGFVVPGSHGSKLKDFGIENKR
jgi:hypothetical protein